MREHSLEACPVSAYQMGSRTFPGTQTPGKDSVAAKERAGGPGRHGPHPANDLRRGAGGRRVDRFCFPGAQRTPKPAPRHQAACPGGGRRTRLHPRPRGGGAACSAQGGQRGRHPAAVRARPGRWHLRGRRGEPAVPRPHQPRHRGCRPAPRLQPAGQLRRRGRPRLQQADLRPGQLERLSRQIPIVTLAGRPTKSTSNVDGDNTTGMRDLARHLVRDHGYRTLAYLGGHVDSPNNLARRAAFEAEVTEGGATVVDGPQWQGSSSAADGYSAAGGARVLDRLLAAGHVLPEAIACANDQSALGVVYALGQRGIDVPRDVAVTGFDDIPVARHLRPQLTTVRHPIQELGATAFEVLYSMIGNGEASRRDVVLPLRLIRRESCGCPPDSSTPAWRQA